MKMEHRAIIDRARRHGALPSEMAHELLVHDLVEAAMFELRNVKAPYSSLNEGCQQEVIDRITEKAKEAASVAVQIINARGAVHVQVDMKAIKVEAKTMTITAKVDGNEPNKHELTDAAGKLCLLVMAPQDYEEGLDFIQPDRDQPDLPLHAGDILDGMGTFDDMQPDDVQGDPLLEDVKRVVAETRRASISSIQRKFGIGYNRSARLIEELERQGLVSAPDSNGGRDVLMPAPTSTSTSAEPELLHTPEEQADDLYGQALAIAREDGKASAGWLQMRLAIGQEQAEALIQRMRDENVIGEPDGKGNHLLIEAESPAIDPNLSVE